VNSRKPEHLIHRHLGAHKGARRLWLEGKRLADVGFLPGVRFERSVTNDAITLRLAAQGSRKVSHKLGRPVVDTLTRELGEVSRIEVRFEPGLVTVRVHPMDLLARDRLRRLNARLARGHKLRLGSVCHGAGIASDAILRGLGGKGALGLAIEHNPHYLAQSLARGPLSKGGHAFEGDLGDLASTPEALADLPELDVLEAGLPCVSASRAGRAKKGLEQPEDDWATADLAHAFLNVVAACKPAVICLENVPEYAGSASAQMIRRSLDRLGYELHEVALGGSDWALEARNRWVLVAVTRGLRFDPTSIVPTEARPATVGEVLDARPTGWKPTDALEAQFERARAKGQGFARGRRILDASATSVPTLRRGYQKAGKTDVRLAHPTRAATARIFSAAEHARIKGIPAGLIAGLAERPAHEVLGQSVIAPAFVSIGAALGSAIGSSVAGKPAEPTLLQLLEMSVAALRSERAA